MIKKLLLILIVVLLTGCTSEVETISWDGNLGTTSTNILMCDGKYAMANGFVYIDRGSSIVEYDLESGKSVVLPMPTVDNELQLSSANSAGNLFLLQSGPAFKQMRSHVKVTKNPDGTVDSEVISMKEIAVLSDGSKSSVFGEFGSGINHFVPMKKQHSSNQEDPSTRPLAGLDVYYSAVYDTFPETAAQLAADGITLEEPEDPEERGRYYIPALYHYDGDTGESRIIERSFGRFYVDDMHIYVVKGEPGNWQLYRSDRQNIDFEPMNLGPVGNKMCSYGDTVALVPAEVQSVCLYSDGNLTELPIQSTRFMMVREKVVYIPVYNVGVQPESTDLLMYDLNTKELETISVCASNQFAILEDRYVAYREITGSEETDFLYDLETGQRIEMYRAGN